MSFFQSKTDFSHSKVGSKGAEVSSVHPLPREAQSSTKQESYTLEINQNQTSKSAKLESSSIKCGSPIYKESEVNPDDFGLILKVMEKLTDQQMCHLIQNRWKPIKNFKFPQTKEGQKTRKVVYDWLETYPWLAYSK